MLLCNKHWPAVIETCSVVYGEEVETTAVTGKLPDVSCQYVLWQQCYSSIPSNCQFSPVYNQTCLLSIYYMMLKAPAAMPELKSPLLRHLSQVPTPKASLPSPILQWWGWGGAAWLMTTHFHEPWEHHGTASQLPEPAATPSHSSCTHPAPCEVCDNVLCVYGEKTFSDLMAVYNISSSLSSFPLSHSCLPSFPLSHSCLPSFPLSLLSSLFPSLPLLSSLYTHEHVTYTAYLHSLHLH